MDVVMLAMIIRAVQNTAMTQQELVIHSFEVTNTYEGWYSSL